MKQNQRTPSQSLDDLINWQKSEIDKKIKKFDNQVELYKKYESQMQDFESFSQFCKLQEKIEKRKKMINSILED